MARPGSAEAWPGGCLGIGPTGAAGLSDVGSKVLWDPILTARAMNGFERTYIVLQNPNLATLDTIGL